MNISPARLLHQDAIVIDTHSDVLNDVAVRRLAGETEVLRRIHLPRWQTGGVNAVVATIFTEDVYKPERATTRAFQILGAGLDDVAETPEIEWCRNRADIEATVADGKIAFLLAIEGAECIQGTACAVRVFYDLGVRNIGFCWNQRNMLAEGVGEIESNGGLTERGREYVRECNRLGIMLDVSHLTPKSFWDTIETSDGPVVASHSNAMALCSHKRNLDDEQLRAIAGTGGYVGINGVAAFISDDVQEASLEKMLDHLDYVANLIGVEQVALGPDFVDFLTFEGESPRTDDIVYPPQFENITMMPNVTAGLLERGYSEADIRGILGLNFLRVMEAACE